MSSRQRPQELLDTKETSWWINLSSEVSRRIEEHRDACVLLLQRAGIKWKCREEQSNTVLWDCPLHDSTNHQFPHTVTRLNMTEQVWFIVGREARWKLPEDPHSPPSLQKNSTFPSSFLSVIMKKYNVTSRPPRQEGFVPIPQFREGLKPSPSLLTFVPSFHPPYSLISLFIPVFLFL